MFSIVLLTSISFFFLLPRPPSSLLGHLLGTSSWDTFFLGHTTQVFIIVYRHTKYQWFNIIRNISLLFRYWIHSTYFNITWDACIERTKIINHETWYVYLKFCLNYQNIVVHVNLTYISFFMVYSSSIFFTKHRFHFKFFKT